LESIFKEDEVISILKRGLKQDGWSVKEQVKAGKSFIDLAADKDGIAFLIEAKGEDKGGLTSAEMNLQMGLGQIMSRMTDRSKKYGLAFPRTADFMKVLQKYEGSTAFKTLDLYLFVAERDRNYFVVPPSDIAAFINDNRT